MQTGFDYLKTLPAGKRDLVKAVGEGRMRIRDVTTYRGNQKMAFAQDIAKAYPTYNQQWVDASYALTKDATTGNIAKNARSLNTAVGHLAEFDKAAQALNNTDITGYNSLANWVAAHTGDPRVIALNETATALKSELASTFKGGASGAAGTDPEMEDWGKNFKDNLSKAQYAKVVEITTKLMGSRLGELSYQFNKVPYHPEGWDVLSPNAKQILESYGFDFAKYQNQETKQQGGSKFQILKVE